MRFATKIDFGRIELTQSGLEEFEKTYFWPKSAEDENYELFSGSIKMNCLLRTSWGKMSHKN